MLFKRLGTGFSLLELIVALAIFTILGLLAVPSSAKKIMTMGVTNAVNQFIGIINMAKTEALRSGYTVRLCGANLDANGNLLAQACNPSSNWSSGVFVYQDNDNSGSYTAIQDRKIQLVKFNSGISVSQGTSLVAVSPDGRIVNPSNFCFSKTIMGNTSYSALVKVTGFSASVICSVANANCSGC